jgi:hypothetical protein
MPRISITIKTTISTKKHSAQHQEKIRATLPWRIRLQKKRFTLLSRQSFLICGLIIYCALRLLSFAPKKTKFN